MKTLLFDFSRVILFPKDRSYKEPLNDLHRLNSDKEGYNFLDYFEFNEELLNYLRENSDSLEASIFTTGTIQKVPEAQEGMERIFQNVYAAKDLGLKKDTPEAYREICLKMGKNTDEVLFIDDTLENVEAAQQAGLEALQFISNEALFKLLEKEK